MFISAREISLSSQKFQIGVEMRELMYPRSLEPERKYGILMSLSADFRSKLDGLRESSSFSSFLSPQTRDAFLNSMLNREFVNQSDERKEELCTQIFPREYL